MQFLNNNKLSLKKASLYTSNTNMFNLKDKTENLNYLFIIYKKSHLIMCIWWFRRKMAIFRQEFHNCTDCAK